MIRSRDKFKVLEKQIAELTQHIAHLTIKAHLLEVRIEEIEREKTNA